MECKTYQVDTGAEAPFGFVVAYLSPLRIQVPYLYVSVLRGTGQVLSILGQGDRPGIRRRQIGRDDTVCGPITLLAGPDLYISLKASTGRPLALGVGYNMVAAYFVGIVDGLHEREIGVGGRVDLER